ncbi:MAG: hypothetical protein DRP11_04090 [Candidatus Aenigmatarchaeota archaeon]|nr:MAG: hypothetical protein DRP11_04090 [Candidatus Aenigmarchaeota archaeon]
MLNAPPSLNLINKHGKKTMKRVLAVIDAVSGWSGKIVSWLIYPGIVVVVYEIVARHVFNAPTIWAHGTSQRIFAAYYLLAGAYVLLLKVHINMDLVYKRFGIRTKAIVDLITSVFFFAFCGVLLWYGADFAWTSLIRLERCHTPFHAPLYPVKLMVPLGAFLLLAQGLAKFIRDLITAITGRQCEY